MGQRPRTAESGPCGAHISPSSVWSHGRQLLQTPRSPWGASPRSLSSQSKRDGARMDSISSLRSRETSLWHLCVAHLQQDAGRAVRLALSTEVFRTTRPAPSLPRGLLPHTRRSSGSSSSFHGGLSDHPTGLPERFPCAPHWSHASFGFLPSHACHRNHWRSRSIFQALGLSSSVVWLFPRRSFGPPDRPAGALSVRPSLAPRLDRGFSRKRMPPEPLALVALYSDGCHGDHSGLFSG